MEAAMDTKTMRTVEFEEAIQILGNDDHGGPPGQAFLLQSGKDWIITLPGEQFRITEHTFKKLAEQQCIEALEKHLGHFVPNKHCAELAATIHA